MYFPALESLMPPRMRDEPVPQRVRGRVISDDEDQKLPAELRGERGARDREQHHAWVTRQAVADISEQALNVDMRCCELSAHPLYAFTNARGTARFSEPELYRARPSTPASPTGATSKASTWRMIRATRR